VIVDGRGERMLGGGPEDGQGTREHHDRAGPERAAGRQQRLGAAQVRPHAEVEVGFAFRADRGREMEDHIRPGQRARPAGRGVQQFAHLTADDGQVGGGRRLVEERHPGQRPCPGAGHVDRSGGEQPPGQT
jgi:hypothetical protein